MIKKLMMLVTAIALLTACSGEKKDAPEKDNEVMQMQVSGFFSPEKEIADKKVEVTGTAVHVCRHSGKRMFIINGDPDKRLKVTTGDDISKFDVDIEGSKVKVIGEVEEKRIDKAYLDEWEQEVKAAEPEEHVEKEEVKTGKECEVENQTNDQLERINQLRAKLKDSKKGYLSFYSVKAEKFEEIK